MHSLLAQFLTSDKITRNENIVRFNDMNLDVQVSILEHLSFPDLFNAAQTSVHFADMAAGVYRRQFAQYAVKIQSNWPIDNSIIVENNTIATSNCDKATKMLQLFGAHIQIMKINFNKISKARAERITTAINKNHFNSLMRLEITDCPTHFWRKEQKPFHNVETLFFKNQLNTIKRLRLNRVFPSVRQLILANVECDHSNCFNCNFSRLNELHIRSVDVEKLLEKNPQIELVWVSSATHDNLKEISNFLPNLKKLSIDWLAWNYFRGNDDFIRFDNVKQVRIKSGPHRIPTKISFLQLEELELGCEPTLSNNWIEYIAANGRHLTKLTIFDTVMNGEFEKLSEKFTNLIEANIKGGIDVNCETVINFVTANPGLKHMSFQTFNADIGNGIINGLQDEWHVDNPTSELGSGMELLTITLERK